MATKSSVKDCKCIHCREKLEQINRSKVYWDKLIINRIGF